MWWGVWCKFQRIVFWDLRLLTSVCEGSLRECCATLNKRLINHFYAHWFEISICRKVLHTSLKVQKVDGNNLQIVKRIQHFWYLTSGATTRCPWSSLLQFFAPHYCAQLIALNYLNLSRAVIFQYALIFALAWTSYSDIWVVKWNVFYNLISFSSKILNCTSSFVFIS